MEWIVWPALIVVALVLFVPWEKFRFPKKEKK